MSFINMGLFCRRIPQCIVHLRKFQSVFDFLASFLYQYHPEHKKVHLLYYQWDPNNILFDANIWSDCHKQIMFLSYTSIIHILLNMNICILNN